MTLNCIWTWYSSSGDLWGVEYLFIAITPRSTLTQSGKYLLVSSMGQIEQVHLDMILNCIWWRDSSSEDMESVEHPFIAIAPRSTQTWSGSTC